MAESHAVEIDPRFGGDFSDDSSEFDSDTTSLDSFVMNSVYENGRGYHGWLEGKYDAPNDEAEQDRMDLHHYIFLLALRGKLYRAPTLKNPSKILDLGTGTGAWAIDCGEFHPEAEVIGVDLSPIQPRWVPENVSFEVDDIEDVWTYKKNSFDLVHVRQLSGFVNDWPKLYKQALRILKPGGILEIKDTLDIGCDDRTVPEGCAMIRWVDLWREGVRELGREIPREGHIAGLTKAGFEDVTYNLVKVPVGTWAKDVFQKELGLRQRQHLVEGCESISIGLFTRVLGWKMEDISVFLSEVRSDFRNPKFHSYSKIHEIYGRKPLDCQ